MIKPIKNYKEIYNRKLKIYKSLEVFVDDPETPELVRAGKMPQVERLMLDLSDLLTQIGTYTNIDVWEGFR